MVETVDSEPGDCYRIAGPLLRAVVAHNITRDYRTLKRLMERG